jgi:hypothetical protein
MLNAEAAADWGTANFIVKAVEDESLVKRKGQDTEPALQTAEKSPVFAHTSRQNAGVKRVKMAAAN